MEKFTINSPVKLLQFDRDIPQMTESPQYSKRKFDLYMGTPMNFEQRQI